MIKKFILHCEKNQLIQKKDNIVVGVSGGADSMCLLFLLHEIASQYELRLVVVHMNHGLRKTAAKDAEYVKRMCDAWEIPFVLFEEDVHAFAKENRLTEEEAGRTLRYKAFYETLDKYFDGNGKIAVAHNRNDRAETVMFNLFRGTGLRGLSGIATVRDKVIRPVLFLDRSEIEQLLKQNDISYCIDETNDEDTYTRNRVRRHIVKYADENICKNAVLHINEAADFIEEAQQYINRVSLKVYEKCVKEMPQGLSFSIDILEQEDPLIAKYVIMRGISILTKGAKDITRKHILSILDLMHNQTGRSVRLPYHLVASREYGFICITCRNDADVPVDSVEKANPLTINVGELHHGQSYSVNVSGGVIMTFTRMRCENWKNVPQNVCTKWFDYDKIGKSLSVRNRETGDFLTIAHPSFEDGVKKMLKEYLINEKIPREERDSLLLLADDKHIVWLCGHRISEYYKVTDKTADILQVEIQGGVFDGKKS